MAPPAAELKLARQILAWDQATMARALRLDGAPETLDAPIDEMEAGDREIDAEAQAAIKAFLTGWRPDNWVEPAPD